MDISVLGTGPVGRSIATKLSGLGHHVMIGTRNVKDKLADTKPDRRGNPPFREWLDLNRSISLVTFKEAGVFGSIFINATLGAHSVDIIKNIESEDLKDKIIIDLSNPLDFSHGMPPSLLPGLNNTYSLGEMIQSTFPVAKVVKTLNTMWNGLMVNPGLIGDGKHINFICGNDAEAKKKVKELLLQLGWGDENLVDLGDITGSRGVEAYLLLWLRILNVSGNGAFNIDIVR
jgi:predicted dinucleotide-binding enzyme